MNQFALMELDFEGRQAHANLHNNVLTVKLMWTIPKPYSEAYYARDWKTQRYNLNYWVTEIKI